MVAPWLIETVTDASIGALPSQAAHPRDACQKKTAADLKLMMEDAAAYGTGRKTFRKLRRRKIFKDFVLALKPAPSMMSPTSSNDWVTAFALTPNGNDGICIGVLAVHGESSVFVQRRWPEPSSITISDLESAGGQNSSNRSSTGAVLIVAFRPPVITGHIVVTLRAIGIIRKTVLTARRHLRPSSGFCLGLIFFNPFWIKRYFRLSSPAVCGAFHPDRPVARS